MAKIDQASLDAIECAKNCEQRIAECGDSLTHVAQTLQDAAIMLRRLHRALEQIECKHVLTFTVTQQMIDAGRETREKGKYCLTCGQLLAARVEQKEQSGG